MAVLEAHLSGGRDRGRNSVVNDDPRGWVGHTVGYDILRERTDDESTSLLRDVQPGAAFDAAERLRAAGAADAKRLQRHRRETRKRLAGAGVIPWVCWPDREMPHGWLASDDLARAIQEWREQAPSVVRSAQIVEAAISASQRAA